MAATAAAKVPVLYSFWRSSCSYRVRIALNLKSIEHIIKPVDILKKDADHLSDEYGKINPMQKIPALLIDGRTIVESLNIMHYLEETRPKQLLMPTDAYQRAKVREICEMIQSGIQPLQNVGLLNHLEYLVGKEKRLEWAQYWIERGLQAVEKSLTACAGKYSVGDEITLADCCLIPQIFNARTYKVDLQPFPTIVRIDKLVETHPAFVAAHPFKQPDCISNSSQGNK